MPRGGARPETGRQDQHARRFRCESGLRTPQARNWYKRAAAADHPGATNNLGQLLEGTDRQAPQ